MISFSTRTLDKAKAQTFNLKPPYGVVGDWSGNLGTMSMLSRGLYYVRIPTSNGMSATPTILRGPYNSPTPLAINQAVDIGYDKDGVGYILGTNYGANLAAGGNPTPIPPPPAGVVTPQSQIGTLRCYQDYIQPSLKININGWKAIINGVLSDYPGTTQFDLTSFVPGSGHCIVGIFIKDDNVTPIAYASTAIALNNALGDADVNDVLNQAYTANPKYTPVWAYAVATGATQILDSNTFLDMRQFIDLFGTSTPGNVSGPGSSTDYALAAWNGTAGTTLRNTGLLTDGSNDLTIPGRLTTQSGRNVAVRVVTAAGAVTVTTADDVVVVNKTSGAATTVNLPSSPTKGDTYAIKDGKGDAATNNITITPASGNIDGASTYVISTNYGGVFVIYNGTQWNVTVFFAGGGSVTAVTGTAPIASSGGSTPAISISDFVASGASHARGSVPDPGSTAGTTKFLREDATWVVPPGGGSLTYHTTQLGSDVTIVNPTTWYDALTLSLAAGTWYIIGTMTLLGNGGAQDFGAQLWDGTTHYASGNASNRTTLDAVTITIHCIVVLGSTTTVKLSGASDNGGDHIKAQITRGGPAAGNTATTLSAIQLA